jgi:GR25 family glycosyltransferase involved in LPS biosynthesis
LPSQMFHVEQLTTRPARTKSAYEIANAKAADAVFAQFEAANTTNELRERRAETKALLERVRRAKEAGATFHL